MILNSLSEHKENPFTRLVSWVIHDVGLGILHAEGEDKDNLPDLILSDIMMPAMDGIELFEYASKDYSLNHISFIFISAKSSPDDIKFGISLGVDDYITKPINEDKMLTIINNV